LDLTKIEVHGKPTEAVCLSPHIPVISIWPSRQCAWAPHTSHQYSVYSNVHKYEQAEACHVHKHEQAEACHVHKYEQAGSMPLARQQWQVPLLYPRVLFGLPG
jgi:hypothetical protein